MTCNTGIKTAGAIITASLLSLGLLALLSQGTSPASRILAVALTVIALAGAYYTLTSTIWMARGLNMICSRCRPRIHPWIQAASCREGGRILCYSNVTKSIYTAEGEVEEAEGIPGMHCAWAIEAEPAGEDMYKGVFLVRGGGVYRVRGVLRVSRIQD